MLQESIYERLNSVFCNVFDDETISVSSSTTANDIDEWDSLMHINLIVAIEDEFGMKFGMKEVTGMKNVGEMVDIISTRTTK